MVRSHALVASLPFVQNPKSDDVDSLEAGPNTVGGLEMFRYVLARLVMCIPSEKSAVTKRVSLRECVFVLVRHSMTARPADRAGTNKRDLSHIPLLTSPLILAEPDRWPPSPDRCSPPSPPPDIAGSPPPTAADRITWTPIGTLEVSRPCQSSPISQILLRFVLKSHVLLETASKNFSLLRLVP